MLIVYNQLLSALIMKNWKKTSLLTALVIVLLLTAVFYLLNLKIIGASSKDISFSPGKVSQKIPTDSLGVKPKNIIVFIADGMGFSHLSLAMLSQQGEDDPLVWQEFSVKGWHDPRSVYGPLTDSEASATAMATGTSTNFGFIGLDKDEKPLKNIMEVASDHQYATGIVTDSYVWDGTPAAFVAHIRNEDDARGILTQIAASELDLIFGELEDVGEDEVPDKETSLEILQQRFSLLDNSLNITTKGDASKPIAAIFEEDEIQDLSSSPNLTRMTEVALEHLVSLNKPFVMLVECEEIDSASHTNDSERTINGLKSIQQTLSRILSFSKANGETLVIFTADHETGGLAVLADFNSYPNVQIGWTTKEHTGAVVPLFADGPGAEYFSNVHRNRDIGKLLKGLISPVVQVQE